MDAGHSDYVNVTFTLPSTSALASMPPLQPSSPDSSSPPLVWEEGGYEGPSVPVDFIGLSFEWYNVHRTLSQPAFFKVVQETIHRKNPAGPRVRVGGHSADRACWNPEVGSP